MSATWESMTPRERDALVAEMVMGWGAVVMGATSVAGGVEPGSHYPGAVPVPPYTTDIAAAWRVVEHMANDGFDFEVSGDPYDGDESRFAYFYKGDSNAPWKSGTVEAKAWASAAPEAICRAALRAMGEDI